MLKGTRNIVKMLKGTQNIVKQRRTTSDKSQHVIYSLHEAKVSVQAAINAKGSGLAKRVSVNFSVSVLSNHTRHATVYKDIRL